MRVPRTLDYPTINLNPRYIAPSPCDHNARPSQTDRQTDERHGNSALIMIITITITTIIIMVVSVRVGLNVPLDK